MSVPAIKPKQDQAEGSGGDEAEGSAEPAQPEADEASK
jgi:hypothetical protein